MAFMQWEYNYGIRKLKTPRVQAIMYCHGCRRNFKVHPVVSEGRVREANVTQAWHENLNRQASQIEFLFINLNTFFTTSFFFLRIMYAAVSPINLKSVEITVIPRSSFKGVSL
jgi:hypothetical protein